MGAADIVPGVSGGTVALILGVYERLVTAISQCNTTLVGLLWSRQWRAAADHIDFRFVLALGTGIAIGIGGLASLMNHLLTHHLSLTFAAFSGMILASSLLVSQRLTRWQMQHFGLLIAGAVLALRLVTLPALQNPPDTLWYLFLCGVIGIIAMILPGISGAFILLLLNRYHYITDHIKGIVHGEVSLAILTELAVFALGCVTGLLSFSRILRWLLRRFHDETMAVLCGFMLGSMYKLWPFQRDLTPEIEKLKYKQFENYLPDAVNSHVVNVTGLVVLGAAVVLVLEFVAVRQSSRLSSHSTGD
jgi:putative membrane protein